MEKSTFLSCARLQFCSFSSCFFGPSKLLSIKRLSFLSPVSVCIFPMYAK